MHELNTNVFKTMFMIKKFESPVQPEESIQLPHMLQACLNCHVTHI